ncbi:MAG: hypothetical protein K2X47_09000 [Bdellovibrionales bacterium]|nr:hypothetical protein [Bdellovibrionales bacterium]
MLEELKDERSPLQYLPSDVIQSGTVQALISQNEDLMARLNAQLRRSAQLEAKAQKLSESQDLLIRQNDQLQDQLAVATEKCESYENSFLKITEQRDEIQTTFAELYTRARDTEQQLRQQIELYHQRILRYQKYRKNIHTKVRPMADQLRTKTADLKHRLDKSENHCLQVQSELTETKSQVRQIQIRLNEALDQSQKDLARLTSHYEDRIATLTDENAQLREEHLRLTRKNAEMLKHSSELTETLVILENKKIWSDRQRSTLETESTERIETLNQELKHARTELRKLEIDVVELGQIKQKLTEQASILENKIDSMEDELIQKNALLDQSLLTISDMKARVEGSQKLNLDLNQSLRAAREDLERLYREKMRLETQQLPKCP